MDAFRSVDASVSKKRAATDQENDWRAWQTQKVSSVSERAAKASEARALPQFPRLGGDKSDGLSHASVGTRKRGREKIQNDATNLNPVAASNEAHDPEEQVKKRLNASQDSKPSQTMREQQQEKKNTKDWAQLVEPGSGKRYWFNNSTGKTRYTDPTIGKNDSSDIRGANPMDQVQAALARTLERGNAPGKSKTIPNPKKNIQTQQRGAKKDWKQWQQVEDPLTRKVCYINNQNGESTWDKPKDFVSSTGAPDQNGSNLNNGKPKASWTRGVQGSRVFWMNRATGEKRFGAKPKS